MNDKMSLETKCVHQGEIKTLFGSPHTPIFNTTTFGFKSTADILDIVEGRKAGPLYSRYGLNPSILSLEEKLASIEGAEAALAFSSGMAAEAALFLALGREGIVCVGDAYGGTLELVGQQLPELGIKTQLLLGKDISKLEAILKTGVGIVFLETPSNPTLEIFDIKAIAELAHRHNALLAVDNTFASPVNQQPLALGADIVIHSATKYLGGHSDLTAGALMGKKEFVQAVWPWRKNLGQTPAPETCSLLSRSLKTLTVRVRQQNETALTLAKRLREHPKVSSALYPGLANFKQHALAKSQMSGFGGMITITVKGGFDDAAKFVDQLKLFTIAPSLGGTESLVTMPVTTTHHGLGAEAQAERGITETMVRISVGLESADDLWTDLNNALN
jgi:cystathionine gamma-synthase